MKPRFLGKLEGQGEENHSSAYRETLLASQASAVQGNCLRHFVRCIFMMTRVDYIAISCTWGLHTLVSSSRDPPSLKA